MEVLFIIDPKRNSGLKLSTGAFHVCGVESLCGVRGTCACHLLANFIM